MRWDLSAGKGPCDSAQNVGRGGGQQPCRCPTQQSTCVKPLTKAEEIQAAPQECLSAGWEIDSEPTDLDPNPSMHPGLTTVSLAPHVLCHLVQVIPST